jgi:hypothetical protein
MGTVLVVCILSLVGLSLVMTVFRLVRGFQAFWKARGKRLVTCPETHRAAAVELDAKRAGLKAFRGGDYLRLQHCSRWPERHDCAQDCLAQVQSLEQGCLVSNVVAGWSRGKVCAYCHKPVDNVADWTSRMSALRGQDSKTVWWDAVPAENLPALFTTYQPVCWSCQAGEIFRQDHPELVAKWCR